MKMAKFAAAAIFAALCLETTTLNAQEPRIPITVKPLHGISLSAGPKYVLSYFANEANSCNTTIIISDKDNDGGAKYDYSRLQIHIDTNREMLLDVDGSKSLAFSCANSGSTMTVSLVERIALFRSEE